MEISTRHASHQGGNRDSGELRREVPQQRLRMPDKVGTYIAGGQRGALEAGLNLENCQY